MALIQPYIPNLKFEYYYSDNEVDEEFDTVLDYGMFGLPNIATFGYHSRQVGALDIDDDYITTSESEVDSIDYFADREYSDENDDESSDEQAHYFSNVFIEDDFIIEDNFSEDSSDEEYTAVLYNQEMFKCGKGNNSDDSSNDESICVKLESYGISVYEEEDVAVKVEIDSCGLQTVKIKVKSYEPVNNLEEDNIDSHELLSCKKENLYKYDLDRMECEALKTIGAKLESGEYFDSLEESLRYNGVEVKMESSEDLCDDDAVRTKMRRNLNDEENLNRIKIEPCNSLSSLEQYLRNDATLNSEEGDENENGISMKDDYWLYGSNEEDLQQSSKKRRLECEGDEFYQLKRCRLGN